MGEVLEKIIFISVELHFYFSQLKFVVDFILQTLSYTWVALINSKNLYEKYVLLVDANLHVWLRLLNLVKWDRILYIAKSF